MRKNFTDSLNNYYENDISSIPKNFILPSNIYFVNLNIDMNYIQSNIQINNIKENYLNNNINLPLSSQGQRGLSLNNNNNILKNNFKMPNTASEKNRYVGQNLGKNIINSFGVKSKSLGKVFKIVNGKNDKNEENNNMIEHKLQSANINKVNLMENAFHGEITLVNRKLSDNYGNNNNYSNKNLNSFNKSKNWNLYDQNGRRIKNNMNIDLNNHNNININEIDNNYSKTPNAKVIIQAGINSMVNLKNIDYNMKGNIYDNIKKPLYKSSLYENNFKRENNENSKDLFNFNDIKFNNYNFNEQNNNNNQNINSQKKFLENSPIKEERSQELIKSEDENNNNNKVFGTFNYKDLEISAIGNNQTLLNNNASIQEIVDFDNNNNNTLLGNNILHEDIIYRDKNDNINNNLNINFHLGDSIEGKKKEFDNNDNYINIIDDNNTDNLLQNLSLNSNRPFTPPVSKIIPENSKNNHIVNIINGDKINESIIQHHYNELVYDKNIGKYFNAKTHIYYDFK